MRKLRTLSWIASIVMLAAGITPRPVSAFTVVQKVTVTAAATITSGSGSGGALALSIPLLLPTQAFFGKNVEIPIQIQGPASTLSQVLTLGSNSGVDVQMSYQQLDTHGAAISGPTSVPVLFQAVPGDPTRLAGRATIPVQSLQTLRQGGTLTYQFKLQNGPTQTIYQNGAAPFQVQFINQMSAPVNDGSVIIVPDTALNDGKTSIFFGPGALSNPGTLVIRQLDLFSVPNGPSGLPPIVAFSFELQGATLLGNAQVTLSYPTNPDGSIIGSNGNPANLSLYSLQGPNWSIVGPPQWSSTLHTLTAPTSRLSVYVLFLAAGTSAADLRPRQRVITPNGDGINDSISFLGNGATEVRIFDVKGRRVRTLHTPSLVWDGRDDDGRIAESGLYIYQYNSQGDLVSGVVLIAK